MQDQHFDHIMTGLEFGLKCAVKVIPIMQKGIPQIQQGARNARMQARLRKLQALKVEMQTSGVCTEKGDYDPIAYAGCCSCFADVGGELDVEEARRLYDGIKGVAARMNDKEMLRRLEECWACVEERIGEQKEREEKGREEEREEKEKE